MFAGNLRLECEAFDDGARRGYRFIAEGSYARLVPAELCTPEVVTPAGFGRLWERQVRVRLTVAQWPAMWTIPDRGSAQVAPAEPVEQLAKDLKRPGYVGPEQRSNVADAGAEGLQEPLFGRGRIRLSTDFQRGQLCHESGL